MKTPQQVAEAAAQQREASKRAEKRRARFIEIERTTRGTAGRNTLKALAKKRADEVTALLEAEQMRLLKTWEKGNGHR